MRSKIVAACNLLKVFSRRTKQVESDFRAHSDNRSVPNVLILTEYINATYFISFDIPLKSLYAKGKVNFSVASQTYTSLKWKGSWEKWIKSIKPDVVIMTRYGHTTGPEILDYFKQKGTPVIYHIDDNLLEIPDSLGAEIQKRQGAQEVIASRSYMLGNCNLIYASTKKLADLFAERFPTQKIYHGIYAPYMGSEIINPAMEKRPYQVIGYMGSKGHKHDLDLVVPALEQLLEDRPELHFEVFGTIQMPAALLRFGNRVRSYSVQKSYSEFLASLAQLQWDIGLAPLVDEKFNQCKAPTKFIEYTASGIPIVASDISVYSDVMPIGGGVLVDTDWRSAIEDFLDKPKMRTNAVTISKQYCEQTFALPILENQIECLLSRY